MGYSVETTGRLLMPAHLENQALTVLEVELAARPGPFETAHEVDTLADLAGTAGAVVRREGDWLLVSTDEEGDPKWSDQATAFYVGLARWVREGHVDLEAEDGATWSYRFGPDGVIQVGQNGWDGSLVPFGEPVPADSSDPSSGAPAHSPVVMTLVLVVGIVLIVGVALLASGI